MTTAIHQRRCLQHPVREAVARCPECTQFYCRECVIEHDDRLICAACLRRLAVPETAKRPSFATLWRGLQVTLGVLAAWLFFYLCGETLLRAPASFHDGAFWQDLRPDE